MRLATIVFKENQKFGFPAVQLASGWARLFEYTASNPELQREIFAGMKFTLGRLSDIRKFCELHPTFMSDNVHSFCPPIQHPPTFRDFYAFEQHVKTCREKRGAKMPPEWYEAPVFYFSNPGSLIGHEAVVRAPQGCKELDYELELGIIIGKGGKDIPAEKAWEHIAGFTIINDFSARDLQRKEMAVGLGPAKGKDFATAVGPMLVTTDEFADKISPEGRIDLEMTARVNGRELSRGNAKSMHFTWPQIVAHASRDAELYTGDLIGSGTVGTGCILELGPENTGGWLKPGDVVELEIERLGVLKNSVECRMSNVE